MAGSDIDQCLSFDSAKLTALIFVICCMPVVHVMSEFFPESFIWTQKVQHEK
jgi:hypothetical protein